MSLLEFFISFAQSDRPTLKIAGRKPDDLSYVFTKMKQGLGLCIFGQHVQEQPGVPVFPIHETLKLYGIYAENTLHITTIGMRALSQYQEDIAATLRELPSGVELLDDTLSKFNQERKEAFAEFYPNIQTRDLSADERACMLRELRVITLKYERKLGDLDEVSIYKIGTNEAMAIVCGFLDVRSYIMNRYADDGIKNEWITEKSIRCEIERQLSQKEGPKNVQPWEERLAKALHQAGENDVTITTTNASGTERVDISSEIVMRRLIEKAPIRSYDIASVKTLTENIRLEHIEQITFENAVLYEKR